MLWRIEIEGGTPAWMEVGTGRLYDDLGTPITESVSYITTDTQSAQPEWYVEPPVIPPPVQIFPHKITRLAFRNRFTQTEKVTLELAAADNPAATMPTRQLAASLRARMADQRDATYVDLDRADTRAGVLALETYGLIAAGRALEILDATVTAEEAFHD